MRGGASTGTSYPMSGATTGSCPRTGTCPMSGATST